MEAEWYEGANACRHIQIAVALFVESGIFCVHDACRSPAEQRELSAVRVSAKRQLRFGLRQNVSAPSRRVVLHHYHERLGRYAVQRLAVVGLRRERRASVVLSSCYHYRVGSAAQYAAFVEQQVPVHRAFQRARQAFHFTSLLCGGSSNVVGVVVVAENREDAVDRMQMYQRGCEAHSLLRTHVEQVAGEEQRVGMKFVHLRHYAPCELLLHRAEVHVRDLHYAVAVEGLRQVVELECDALHVQLVGSYHRSHEQHV